jgi:hypothetical protein
MTREASRGARLLLAVPLAMAVASCHLGLPVLPCSQNPVELPEARTTIRDAGPVLAALRASRDQTGHFPNRLEELVPQYLDRLPPPHGTASQLRYHRREAGFDLMFSFSTTCAHECRVRTPTGEWECISYD